MFENRLRSVVQPLRAASLHAHCTNAHSVARSSGLGRCVYETASCVSGVVRECSRLSTSGGGNGLERGQETPGYDFQYVVGIGVKRVLLFNCESTFGVSGRT